MNVTDPIADLLTRIRNALLARHSSTRVPGSKMKWAIAQILAENGYVGSAEWIDEGPQGTIELTLRYDSAGKPLIRGIRRESRPSQRRYVKKDAIPEVLNGLGIAILSTSHGVMSCKQAREAATGGELLASVW